jgi:pyrimidine-nucleoside phosphorylase
MCEEIFIMDIRDVILDKRYGRPLSKEQIAFFVKGVTDKTIPDYQISALLMAIVLNGMDSVEMTELTLRMAESGETCDLSGISDHIVDKHSTGGVGDKCTPIILPLVASFGVPIVKLSGRGLGFTGGTIDKLESIRGFKTEIPVADFPEYIRRCGAVLSAQTPELAPADKELYSLRDVTGTVDSIPLIASSIMSKKIAGGANAIVLDVTCGNGAFMKDTKSAVALSNAMINIGKIAGRPVTCVISSMRQPLGFAVGNILEMREVEDFFNGKTSEDLLTVCLTLAASMLRMSGLEEAKEFSKAYALLQEKVQSGEARDTFLSFIRSQGGAVNSDGSLAYCDRPVLREEIQAETEGYIHEVLASDIGRSSVLLGAGRRLKTDRIDYGAGITVQRKIGDYVRKGDCLCSLYTGEKGVSDNTILAEASTLVRSAYRIASDVSDQPVEIIDILG